MQEHEKIPYDSLSFQDYWGEGMRLPSQNKGLDRWFFQWQWRNNPIIDDEQDSEKPVVTESGYYASYVIGAQWFDEAKTMPLVITTKHGCDRIDFLKMFSIYYRIITPLPLKEPSVQTLDLARKTHSFPPILLKGQGIVWYLFVFLHYSVV